VDYFGDPAYLTQSGQLYIESTALALGKVYSFGPTFRAEKSKTRRHLTEFWMVEPEVAFLELDGLLSLAEAYITHIVTTVLTHHHADLKVIGKDIAKLEAVIAPTKIDNAEKESVILSEALSEQSESKGAVEEPVLSLSKEPASGNAITSASTAEKNSVILSEGAAAVEGPASGNATKKPNKFPRLSYDEAHAMLEKAFAEGKIEAPHKYGDDFGSPDEKPVMIHRYPAAIKAFYMQPDPLDPTKALCVDVLAPEGYGEIIGGSQRVDSYDLLKARIEEHNLPLAAFQWYLDLRKYGSVPHAGFGMGIERVVAWICGLDHVRETIPFARTLNRIYP
jgi:asparaginyl-tRNA synthetase